MNHLTPDFGQIRDVDFLLPSDDRQEFPLTSQCLSSLFEGVSGFTTSYKVGGNISYGKVVNFQSCFCLMTTLINCLGGKISYILILGHRIGFWGTKMFLIKNIVLKPNWLMQRTLFFCKNLCSFLCKILSNSFATCDNKEWFLFRICQRQQIWDKARQLDWPGVINNDWYFVVGRCCMPKMALGENN